MPGARACHSSAAVGGKIFVFGGLRADGPVTSVGENNQLTDVLVFDPCGAAWTKRNPMPHPRSCASASLLGDQIAIVGGFTNAPVRDADSTLLYDPATDTWSTLGGLTQPRAHLSAATAGGRLLAIGGYDGTTVALRSVEAFDASANAWSQVGLLATGRWSLGAAVVGGAVVVAGGSGPGGDGGLNALASVEQLSSPFADSSLLPAMPFGRTSPAVTALGDTVYVIGGTNVDHTPSNLTSVARLPASTGKWEEVAALRQNRSGATAVALGGQVYVLGGNKNAVTVSSCTGDCTIGSLASVEVFTP
jgi:N-acetylneuraminic acid mutarotase